MSDPIILTIIYIPIYIFSMVFFWTKFDSEDNAIAISNISSKLPQYRYLNILNFIVLSIVLFYQANRLNPLLPNDTTSIIYLSSIYLAGVLTIGVAVVTSQFNQIIHNAIAYLLYAVMSVAYMCALYFSVQGVAPWYIFAGALINIIAILILLFMIGIKRDYENRMAWNMEWISVILSAFFVLSQSVWILEYSK